MTLARVLSIPFCLTMASVVHGHHSDAGYNRDAVVVLEAEVVRYVFRNPHVTIFVEAQDEDGRMIEWEIETGSTPIMQRSGWTRDLLSPGDTVIVRAHPERTGRMRAILNTLETNDGRLWSQVERDSEATGVSMSLDGVWKTISATSLTRQSEEHAVLTPAGQAARDSYNEITDDPNNICIPHVAPFNATSSNYLTGFEILEDRVMLRNEMFDVERTAYTDGRGHPENLEPTVQGHSIGRWEDDVLVVDTIGFAPHRNGNAGGVQSSSARHLVERYSLSEDGTRAIVEVVLEDPEYLAEPFTGRMEWTYVPHLQLYRYNCTTE